MNYKIPTPEELKQELITALVRLKIHHPDPESEILEAWSIVEEVGKDLPKKPRYLKLVE